MPAGHTGPARLRPPASAANPGAVVARGHAGLQVEAGAPGPYARRPGPAPSVASPEASAASPRDEVRSPPPPLPGARAPVWRPQAAAEAPPPAPVAWGAEPGPALHPPPSWTGAPGPLAAPQHAAHGAAHPDAWPQPAPWAPEPWRAWVPDVDPYGAWAPGASWLQGEHVLTPVAPAPAWAPADGSPTHGVQAPPWMFAEAQGAPVQAGQAGRAAWPGGATQHAHTQGGAAGAQALGPAPARRGRRAAQPAASWDPGWHGQTSAASPLPSRAQAELLWPWTEQGGAPAPATRPSQAPEPSPEPPASSPPASPPLADASLRRTPLALALMAGDDVQAVLQALRTGGDVRLREGPDGGDAVVLAHRLGRRQALGALFAADFAEMPSYMQPMLQVQMTLDLAAALELGLGATSPTRAYLGAALVPQLAHRQAHWHDAAVLGELLQRLDQGGLLNDAQRRALGAAAGRLGYNLEADNLRFGPAVAALLVGAARSGAAGARRA